VLICGRTPPLASLPKYQQIRDKVVELYRVFFFGEQITQFEREVELKYLMDKQIKFMKYVNHRDNLLYRCKWTDSNQRCLEQYVSAECYRRSTGSPDPSLNTPISDPCSTP
jgi:hypothetical protein